MKLNTTYFTLDSPIPCLHCNSINTYKYSSDATTFNQGRGVVNTDHHCNNCDSNFRVHTNFKYWITEQETCY